MSFAHLPLCSGLQQAFASLGYTQPFPVQEQAIPAALAGHDLVVQAQTGSGKTVAFLAPLLHRLTDAAANRRPNRTQALVIVPTRELAMQVLDRAKELAQHLPAPIKIRAAFGGVSVNTQMLALRGGADLAIGTPGRILDLAHQNALRFDDLRFLVIDEADKLLSLGFLDEVSEIKALLPAKRQTLLFSATMNTAVEKVVQLFLRDPQHIQIEALPEQPLDIREKAYLLPSEAKGPFLRELLIREGWSQVLVFVGSGRMADNIVRKLEKNGIHAMALHGERSQGSRTEALNRFRNGSCRILVATDVLSRGIDVSDLPCVINYDLPRSARDYVHRIGRTGRAGSTGVAVSLVGPEEEAHLRLIEKTVGRKIARENPM